MGTFLLHLTRRIRAEARDLRVLLNESRVSLLLFAGIVIGGAAIFHWSYTFPGTQEHPTFTLALYGTFGLIFFEGVLPFPGQWYLQPLFFIIPILGLAAVLDGVGRFGSALLDKQKRGQKWQVAMASTFQHHIIICGLGKTGYRTALELLRFKRDVVAVEGNENGRFVEQAKALGIPVIIADARQPENLTKAGVTRADAIIPCTDDELTNLDIALDARELNPSIKVVLRMFDPDLARRVEKGFGIRTALSTSALAAPIFAAAAMRIDTQYSFYVGEQLLNLSEIRIEPGAALVGWTVQKLEAQIPLTVVGFQHGNTMDVHPHPMHELHAGDKLLVLAAEAPLKQLNDLAHAQMIY